MLLFTAPDSPGDTNTGNWSTPQTVTVTAAEDDDASSETMTLTHTAAIGEDAVTVSNVSVRVTVNDNDVGDRRVTVTPTTLDSGRGWRQWHVHRESRYPAHRPGDGRRGWPVGRGNRESVAVDLHAGRVEPNTAAAGEASTRVRTPTR